MIKIIIIESCDFCPIFDREEWVCRLENRYVPLPTGDGTKYWGDRQIPEWCPLEDIAVIKVGRDGQLGVTIEERKEK